MRSTERLPDVIHMLTRVILDSSKPSWLRRLAARKKIEAHSRLILETRVMEREQHEQKR